MRTPEMRRGRLREGMNSFSTTRPRADSETGHRFAGGVPTSSDTGAAADSPAGLLGPGVPGDLLAPGDRLPPARSSQGTIGYASNQSHKIYCL
jgi:hypothetical protein